MTSPPVYDSSTVCYLPFKPYGNGLILAGEPLGRSREPLRRLAHLQYTARVPPCVDGSRARNRSRMLTALFSSRSITSPQVPQRYVRFHSGMGWVCPQRLQVLLLLRSSITSRTFPA